MKTDKVLSRVFSVALLVLFLWAMLARGTTTQSDVYALDGAMWNKATSLIRVMWLGGYRDGFFSGVILATAYKSDNGKEGITVAEKLRLRNLQRYGNHPRILSNQAIMDEMTLFYKDFRNTPVCWLNAEPIAELALTIGAPTDAELDAIRAEDAKNGCTIK
jgi:hypothetical protein